MSSRDEMEIETASEISRVADALAGIARQIAVRRFRSGINVEYKGDRTPVTDADREIEHALREALKRLRPKDAIFGEEFGGSFDGDVVWIIDPIDGTKSFASGNPLFGTLVGAVSDGCPIYGLIDMPILAERWAGTTDRTLYQGLPAAVSRCRDLSAARLYCTSRDLVDERTKGAFSVLSKRVAFTRYSGDCYTFGLLASGFCDICIEAGMQTYDFLPIVPIIEGAGGIVSDWSGRPLRASSDGTFVAASSPELWEAVLSSIGHER